MNRLCPMLRQLLRDARGVSLIEFAIVAPFLMLLVAGVSDFGRGFATKWNLQKAANRTIEMALLGSGSKDFEYLVPEAATAAGVPQANVSLEKWVECDRVSKPWTETCDIGTETSKYVKLTINSKFRPFFRYLTPQADANGDVAMSARSTLRIS